MPRASYHTCVAVSEACPVSSTTYGYYPNLGVNSFFAAFFGILLIVQLAIGLRTRTWSYTIALGIGTLLECLGYVGRVLMHENPWNNSAFEMQICCIVLAPSFIAAAIYLTLKHVVKYCGPEHSLLKASLYPWVFVGCDLGSIILQAIGGGTAAAAGNQSSRKLLNVGDGLIVAGISFQVVTMTVCGILVLTYYLRFRRAAKTGQTGGTGSGTEMSMEKSGYEQNHTNTKMLTKFRLFCVAVGLAFVTIFIRCIYRIPEMAGGWGNPLMQRETEFLLLDGMMIGIAVLSLTVMHPGIFFIPMRFASRKTTAQ